MALVVGNSDYEHMGRLANPVNDARDIAEALERLDFDVTLEEDASYADMAKLLKAFVRQRANAAIALVFYAGHGMELEGRNYLLPVDAEVAYYEQVPHEAPTLDRVLSSMPGAGLRVVILDACRNLPQASRIKAVSALRCRGRGRRLGTRWWRTRRRRRGRWRRTG